MQRVGSAGAGPQSPQGQPQRVHRTVRPDPAAPLRRNADGYGHTMGSPSALLSRSPRRAPAHSRPRPHRRRGRGPPRPLAPHRAGRWSQHRDCLRKRAEEETVTEVPDDGLRRLPPPGPRRCHRRPHPAVEFRRGQRAREPCESAQEGDVRPIFVRTSPDPHPHPVMSFTDQGRERGSLGRGLPERPGRRSGLDVLQVLQKTGMLGLPAERPPGVRAGRGLVAREDLAEGTEGLH